MEAGANKGSTILCVDDEPTALLLRKLVLEKFGFTVITVPSGAEALKLLQSTKVDLVLSDLLMPVMQGSELARLIKEQHPNLPVVIISGVNEIPREAFYADLFISKLEGPQVLCDRLKTMLSAEQMSAKIGTAH